MKSISIVKYILLFFCVSMSHFCLALNNQNKKSAELELKSPLYSYDAKVVQKYAKTLKKAQLLKMMTKLNSEGFSPLHFSVASGFDKVTLYYLSLLRKPYQVRTTIKERFLVSDDSSTKPYHLVMGMSLVDIAAKRGDLRLVKKLIKSGYELTSLTRQRYSTLMYAVESLNDNLELVKWLVGKGQSLQTKWRGQEDTLIYLSAQASNTEISKWLFFKLSKDRRYKMKNGVTPLFYALVQKNKALSLFFIKHLKDPNATINPSRLSLLQQAVSWGDLDVVKALSKSKIKINHRDRFERSAFQYAVIKGHLAVVDYFLNELRVPLNDPENKESILYLGLKYRHPELALMFLKKGTFKKLAHEEKVKLFKMAIDLRYFHVVKEMAKDKKALTLKDNDHKTVREYGKKSKDSYIRSLF